MSALHEAVTRAIADALPLAPPGWEVRATLPSDYDRAAAMAIGVCLAEAQRAVGDMPAGLLAPVLLEAYELARADALAVLAALAEEQA